MNLFYPLFIRQLTFLAAAFASVAISLPAQARGGLPDFTKMAAQYGPAVVNISTTQKSSRPTLPPGIDIPELPEGPWGDLFRHFFGDKGGIPDEEFESRSLGSGFIIDSAGYILTNNHVVEDAEEIRVRLSDRRELVAEVVGADPRSDVALLKVEAGDLPLVKLGSSRNLEVGEWVMAIGSPFGFDHSVSVGVVSALGRSLPSESYVPFIQTDVAINPGNSGGPLFNLDGEVIGVNSQIYSRTGGFMGLSFAIPIDVAMDVASQLKERGFVTRGWLGVLIQDVTRDLADSFDMKTPAGALVSKVLEGSPAEKAGIQVGDIILAFNGERIGVSSDLPPLVGATPVDKRVPITLLREGKQHKLQLTIGELPGEDELKQAQTGKQAKADRLGLAVADLEPAQREQRSVPKGGVLVTEVVPGAARDAGLRPGDIILRLNGEAVDGARAFNEQVKQLPAGKSVPVLVQRESGPLFLALKVPE